jgi:hypothetical protein
MDHTKAKRLRARYEQLLAQSLPGNVNREQYAREQLSALIAEIGAGNDEIMAGLGFDPRHV